MKILIRFLFIISIVCTSCSKNSKTKPISEDVKVEDTYVKDNYDKQEVTIEMRDGIKLHTTIYSPKDTSTTYSYLKCHL